MIEKKKILFLSYKKFFSSSFFRIQDNLEKEERRKNEKELWLEIFDPKKEEEVKQKNKFRSKKNVLNLNSFLFRTRKGHRSGKGPVVPEKKIEGNKYRFGGKKENRGVSQLLFFLLSDDDLNFFLQKQPGGRTFLKKKENCEKV